jgi:hypothetical protein
VYRKTHGEAHAARHSYNPSPTMTDHCTPTGRVLSAKKKSGERRRFYPSRGVAL